MYTADKPQTTEWDDIHRKLRDEKTELEIYKEKKEIQAKLDEAYVAAREKVEMEQKSLDELDELEDDLDEEFFAHLKKKRLRDMKERIARARFGELSRIRGPDYVAATHEPGVNCVVHLCQEHLRECRFVNKRLGALARKFPEVKFVWITATEAADRYPDRLCPALVLYRGGRAVKRLVGLAEIGGQNLTDDELEYTLAEHGVLETRLEHDPRSRARAPLSSRLAVAKWE